MKLNKSLVCVTGATGMLGRELTAQLLEAGARVRLIVRDPAKVATPERVEIIICQLDNPAELAEAFEGSAAVFNCAAKVSFRFDEIEEIIRTNTEIARHVVNACMAAKVGRLIHVSSIAALGSNHYGGLIDERCYPETISGWNGYSISKYYSENEVWRGSRSGLETVIVNPSVILGPGDWQGNGSAALFAAFASGIPFYTEGVTGYVDVRDVARAMIMLAEHPDAAGRRFILSAENLSFKEIITKVAAITGKRPPKIRAGRTMLRAARLFSRKITPGIINSALSKKYYSNLAIRKMGFEFTPIDRTIEYMAEMYNNREQRS